MCEWTPSDSLRKHARAVEYAMRAYARQHDADLETWGVTGLLHDFDYERYPDERHPQAGDRVAPRTIHEAILEGRRAATAILSGRF